MQKTLHIQGMTCHKCEQHVRTVLEEFEGVKVHSVSQQEGLAIAEIPDTVSEEEIKREIGELGYQVREIENR